MIKIGEFAKLFNVSIKTIRFYEEKNLLKPAYIDEFSGYRYYNNDNIEKMKKILYLKDLGFSLEEIKNYNDDIVQDKIEEYKKIIAKLTSSINVLEERLILDNRDLEVASAREKYIAGIKNLYKNKGGLNMLEENIYQILSKEEGLLLGKDVYLPSDKRGNTNCLVVAGSGAGKSAAYIIPNIYRTLGSYIVTDPLGEIYNTTHEYMKAHGYIVKAINYKDSPDNYNYDPINHIKSDKDIDILAEILIGDNNDLFWDDSAKLLVKTILYYIMEKAEKKDLLTLFYLLSDKKENLFTKFDEFAEDSKGYKFARVLRNFPEKTYESIASTALVKISFIINKISDTIDLSEKMNFDEMYEKKTIYYINFSESNKDDQKIANIFISQLLSQLDRRDNLNDALKEHIYVFLDEIGMLGKINNLSNNILTARSRKISISLITHNFSSLEKLYGDEMYSMFNSIDTQMILGTNIKSDAEYFAGILGLDIEKIKHLDNDKLFIFEKGLNAIEAEKDYYFKHEEWK